MYGKIIDTFNNSTFKWRKQVKTFKVWANYTEGLDSKSALFFDVNTADTWASEIKSGLQAPYVSIQKSTLGGEKNVSLLIRLSLDPSEEWVNKIFHNSRYANLQISRDGSMEMFSNGTGLKNMRKTKVKSAADVVKKINTWAKTE